jgi:3-dehydroquinate synthetase
MKNTKIIVKTKSKSYPVYFGDGILNTTGTLINKNLPNVKKICIIFDKNLPLVLIKKLSKSLRKYNLKFYRLPAREKTKSFKVAEKIIDFLLKNNFNRSDCIIAFGGGILGDLSAFISSLTKRGVKFINIPTTLLAQADASIGGKT